MPRRTSRKPRAARSPIRTAGGFHLPKTGPQPAKRGSGRAPCGKRIRTPACGGASGPQPAERPQTSVSRVSGRRRGGAAGPRGVRMPHFPALKGKQTPAASRPREAATLRRTSAHRLSARTVPRRRIRSPPEPDSLTPGRGVRPFRAPSCRTFPPEIRRFAPRDGGLNRYILEFGIFSLYLHVERAIRFE